MAADGRPPPPERDGDVRRAGGGGGGFMGNHLQEFELYETGSNFYMIGMDNERETRKVLKIGRRDNAELDLCEDSATYSAKECRELLERIHEGNRSTGGLKFVTNCYGIVGFARFLGPYYMLLITKRRAIGDICGHTIYAILESRIITISGSQLPPRVWDFRSESRYKKLLCMVDLTKDFFFSYSFHIMRSFQKNFSEIQTGEVSYDTMFVWNEFLTRGIRNLLKNTLWTVALVYGFFRQANIKLHATGKVFKLTLIARRSRHYAGTRFLKRGVNETGSVANDVETEQIVFEDVLGEHPSQISSVVQYRGSIPLFWSQEASKLNLKPDIILQENDQNYRATKLHFENLVERYGNPVIILNLIKTHEKKPRETKLWVEFSNAIESINKQLSEEDQLRFLHWDLSRYSKREATSALSFLGKVAACALQSTGFFYSQLKPTQMLERHTCQPINGNDSMDVHIIRNTQKTHDQENINSFINNSMLRSPMLQRGILRTNCIDCLDRTNVAQYAYGLAALGRQLHVLGLTKESTIDLDEPLADELMSFYEIMGDTLALQYTGSAAHNKIFSERRGHWKAAIQSQEFLRTLQRYYSNAYMDATKQAAINVFLGKWHPQKGEPVLWDADSDLHSNAKRDTNNFTLINSRTSVRRSFSDGNVSSEYMMESGVKQKRINSEFLNRASQDGACNDLSSSPSETKLDVDGDKICSSSEHSAQSEPSTHYEYERTSSNFLDSTWLSPYENFWEEATYKSSIAQELSGDRTEVSAAEIVLSQPTDSLTLQDAKSGIREACDDIGNMSERFVHWVISGGTFYH